MQLHNNGGHSWLGDERGPYVRMYSGRLFFLADPKPEDFNLGDIARHLAGINRYTGGSRFTVAQHCVVASRMAERYYPGHRYLPAKMVIHDADEAYYGDVSSPLKSLLGDYKYLEQKGQLAIESFCGLGFVDDPLVKEVDIRMWLSEREYLTCCGGPGTNDYTGPLKPFEYASGDFDEWPADEAEAEWLATYRRLLPWHQ